MDFSEKKDNWVKLVSVDGFSFVVQRRVAMGSGTLKGMLESEFTESISSTCNINERGIVVEKMLEYLMYKKLYETAGPREDIPDFQERIIPEIALELLMAADYYET
ncbi:POZ domain-containing protein [Phellopilus nigrolimitatus]|nr:POZ domain-containing protein [Phellopilus nigrolimitatus]